MRSLTLDTTHTTSKKEPITLEYKRDGPKNDISPLRESIRGHLSTYNIQLYIFIKRIYLLYEERIPRRKTQYFLKVQILGIKPQEKTRPQKGHAV